MIQTPPRQGVDSTPLPAAAVEPVGIAPAVTQSRQSTRLMVETMTVLILTVGLAVVANLAPSIAVVPGLISLFLPLAYLLVERRARHRPWAALGIRRGFVAGLRATWWLFLLDVVVIQAVSVGLAKAFWPAEIAHVSGRIPSLDDLVVLVPLILVLTFREELVYRGLFQERVGWFAGQALAIAGVSVLFALTHIQAGPAAVVAADLLFVFIDSLFYGVIYQRTTNVFVSWAAHAGADLVGIALLTWAAA